MGGSDPTIPLENSIRKDLAENSLTAVYRFCGYMLILELCLFLAKELIEVSAGVHDLSLASTIKAIFTFLSETGNLKSYIIVPALSYAPFLAFYVVFYEVKPLVGNVTIIFRTQTGTNIVNMLSGSFVLIVLLVLLWIIGLVWLLLGDHPPQKWMPLWSLFLTAVYGFISIKLKKRQTANAQTSLVRLAAQYFVFAVIAYLTPFAYVYSYWEPSVSTLFLRVYVPFAFLVGLCLLSLDALTYIAEYPESDQPLDLLYYPATSRMMALLATSLVLTPATYMFIYFHPLALLFIFGACAFTFLMAAFWTRTWEEMAEPLGTGFLKNLAHTITVDREAENNGEQTIIGIPPQRVLLWTKRASSVTILVALLAGRDPRYLPAFLIFVVALVGIFLAILLLWPNRTRASAE